MVLNARGFSPQVPAESLILNKGIQRVARNWLLVYILRTNDQEYENLTNSELRYRALDIKILILSFLMSQLPIMLGGFLILALVFINFEYLQVESIVFVSFLFLFLRFVQTLGKMSDTLGNAVAVFPQFKIACTHSCAPHLVPTLPEINSPSSMAVLTYRTSSNITPSAPGTLRS